jgi:hypothetical protein
MTDTKKINIKGSKENVQSQTGFAIKKAGEKRDEKTFKGLSLAQQMMKDPEKFSPENKNLKNDVTKLVKEAEEKAEKIRANTNEGKTLAYSSQRAVTQQLQQSGYKGRITPEKLNTLFQKSHITLPQKNKNPYGVDLDKKAIEQLVQHIMEQEEMKEAQQAGITPKKNKKTKQQQKQQKQKTQKKSRKKQEKKGKIMKWVLALTTGALGASAIV